MLLLLLLLLPLLVLLNGLLKCPCVFQAIASAVCSMLIANQDGRGTPLQLNVAAGPPAAGFATPGPGSHARG